MGLSLHPFKTHEIGLFFNAKRVQIVKTEAHSVL